MAVGAEAGAAQLNGGRGEGLTYSRESLATLPQERYPETGWDGSHIDQGGNQKEKFYREAPGSLLRTLGGSLPGFHNNWSKKGEQKDERETSS